MSVRFAVGIAFTSALISCGPDTPSPDQAGGEPPTAAATAAELERMLAAGTTGPIELTGDRYETSGLELSGTGITLVGRGARQTVLEGPLKISDCVECGLEDLTVIVSAAVPAILEVSGGSVELRNVRVGEASDVSEVGIVASGSQLSLERVWVQTGSIGLRAREGGGLTIRHSIFEDIETAIEAPPDTGLTLIDNLFADIQGCVVRPTAPNRASILNAVFGNVRIPTPSNPAQATGCLEMATLGPRDADATPVLLELRQSEALTDSPALDMSGPR